MMLREYDAKTIQQEIVQCVAQHVFDGQVNSYKSAEKFLKELFSIAGGNFEKPDYDSIMKVLKLIAARQLKKGKDTKVITNTFKSIAKKVESLAIYT